MTIQKLSRTSENKSGANINLGRFGEDRAGVYLVSKGYKIVQKNFRAPRYGEVDIIVLSPDNKETVFVEVKSRRGNKFGGGEAAITPGKIRELNKMVDYFYLKNPNFPSPRIDVVVVDYSDHSEPEIRHYINITI